MTGAIAIGVGAGLVAGLLGVGGGVLFVPGLVIFVGLSQHQAEATAPQRMPKAATGMPTIWWMAWASGLFHTVSQFTVALRLHTARPPDSTTCSSYHWKMASPSAARARRRRPRAAGACAWCPGCFLLMVFQGWAS